MTSGSTPTEPNCRSERARSTVASAVQRSRLNRVPSRQRGPYCAATFSSTRVRSHQHTALFCRQSPLWLCFRMTRFAPGGPSLPPLAFSRRERDVTTRHRTPQNLAITIKTRTDGWRNIHTHWLRQAGSQLARFSRQGNSFAGQYPAYDAQRPEGSDRETRKCLLFDVPADSDTG